MDLLACESGENYKSTVVKASKWGCKELENTDTTQHALETFKPEGVLRGGGCGERRLEGGWWDHWTHNLTAAWLVCPKTRKGESWEETTWGENTCQTLPSPPAPNPSQHQISLQMSGNLMGSGCGASYAPRGLLQTMEETACN